MVTVVPFSKTVSVPGILYGFEHFRINIGTGGYLRRVSGKGFIYLFTKYQACLIGESGTSLNECLIT